MLMSSADIVEVDSVELEASDAADEEDIVECPRPKEEMVELALRIEGPMTEEQVNVDPPKDDCVNSSSEKAPLAAAAGFLLLPRQ